MSFQLSESLAVQLLDRLGNDDAFRTVFAADPRQALAQLGFAPAADLTVSEGIWKCLQVSELASKEAVLASRDALIRQVTAERSALNPISLEVQPKLRAAA
jgi:putative modified peptide